MIWQLRLATFLALAGLITDAIDLLTGRELVHLMDSRANTFASLQLAVAAILLWSMRRELLGRPRPGRTPRVMRARAWFVVGSIGAIALFKTLSGFDGSASLPHTGAIPFWLYVAAIWLTGWGAVRLIAEARPRGRAGARARALAAPLVFGATLLVLWEKITFGANIAPVLLPPPSMIAERLWASTGLLAADFVQTFVKGALTGWALGSAAAVLVALAIDRSPFLQRGLLPIGNLAAALPIVGIAPIMVMWFGFDWQSKAAVVTVMVFFPVLVNALEGLRASDPLMRDLMRTYAASYWQTLVRLRLPAAAPFLFNGLKIASTLALIGAIVAEFFGTPLQGMGFRISTEIGRMNVDMVWATIAVAAVAGSAFYGLVMLAERRMTFWHPSVRG